MRRRSRSSKRRPGRRYNKKARHSKTRANSKYILGSRGGIRL